MPSDKSDDLAQCLHPFYTLPTIPSLAQLHQPTQHLPCFSRPLPSSSPVRPKAVANGPTSRHNDRQNLGSFLRPGRLISPGCRHSHRLTHAVVPQPPSIPAHVLSSIPLYRTTLLDRQQEKRIIWHGSSRACFQANPISGPVCLDDDLPVPVLDWPGKGQDQRGIRSGD